MSHSVPASLCLQEANVARHPGTQAPRLLEVLEGQFAAALEQRTQAATVAWRTCYMGLLPHPGRRREKEKVEENPLGDKAWNSERSSEAASVCFEEMLLDHVVSGSPNPIDIRFPAKAGIVEFVQSS